MGVLEYIYEQLKIRRHLVIVVAEGRAAVSVISRN